jgi:hypothetical protein
MSCKLSVINLLSGTAIVVTFSIRAAYLLKQIEEMIAIQLNKNLNNSPLSGVAGAHVCSSFI